MTLDELAGAPEVKEKKSNKAVLNGVLQSVSPSQIKTFNSCARSWWFDKVAGLRPEEEAEHFAVGTNLHKQQEDFYEFGKLPENESCRLVLSYPGVPDRRISGLFIEEPRNYDLGLYAAGIPMRGRIDLRAPPNDGTFTILDWKSCKNFKYCKTPEELARDIQGIVYLKYGFRVYPETKWGRFIHAYIRTEKLGAQVVDSGPLDRNHVDAVYQEIENTVEQIKITAAIKNQDEVPYNKSACFAYGGCPYQKHCNAFRKKKETNETMNTLDNGFLARMRAAKNKDTQTTLQVGSNENKSGINFEVPKTGVVGIASGGLAPEVNIVPPDAPKPEKQEPGPEVKKILDEISERGYVDDHSESKTTSARDCLYLYVDCFPVKRQTTIALKNLEDLIKEVEFGVYKSLEAQGKLSKSTPCFDLRQVPYGQGVAELVARFKQNPPTGLVLASSNGLSGIVAEALIPLATEVYKGVR